MHSVPVPSGEHDCLMSEIQIRPNPTSTKKHKHPTNWLKAHLCQNKLTFGLCLSLFLSLAIVISLLVLYILHTRTRPMRKCSNHRSMISFVFCLELCLTPECITLAANTYNAMDATVDPCEVGSMRRDFPWIDSFDLKDFYQFACGNWDKSHPIPEGRNVRSSFETFVNDAVDLYRGI